MLSSGNTMLKPQKLWDGMLGKETIGWKNKIIIWYQRLTFYREWDTPPANSTGQQPTWILITCPFGRWVAAYHLKETSISRPSVLKRMVRNLFSSTEYLKSRPNIFVNIMLLFSKQPTWHFSIMPERHLSRSASPKWNSCRSFSLNMLPALLPFQGEVVLPTPYIVWQSRICLGPLSFTILTYWLYLLNPHLFLFLFFLTSCTRTLVKYKSAFPSKSFLTICCLLLHCLHLVALNLPFMLQWKKS